MKVVNFNRPVNPLATEEAKQKFIDSQISKFGLKAGDIKDCSYRDGDFYIYMPTSKQAAINLVIESVYGKNKKKYLGLAQVYYWGETSLIVQ